MSRMCKRHGVEMRKTRGFDNKPFYACPKDKCSYKENEAGEKIQKEPMF